MKKNHRIVSATIFTALTTSMLLGCSVSDSNEEKNVTKTETKTEMKNNTQQKLAEINKMKKISDLEITPTKISIYKKREPVERKPPKHVVAIDIKVQNTGSEEKGIGALDFKAFNGEGKEIKHYGYADSLGDVVESGKSYKGKLYYISNMKDLKKIEFSDPVTKKKVLWSF